jgi:hypothetical protein
MKVGNKSNRDGFTRPLTYAAAQTHWFDSVNNSMILVLRNKIEYWIGPSPIPGFIHVCGETPRHCLSAELLILQQAAVPLKEYLM